MGSTFPGSWVLVAFKAKIGNNFGYLPGSFGKVEIVTCGAVLRRDRLMNEPVLEEGFMAVLGLSCPGKEQCGQDDEECQDVNFRTAHPCMDITVMVVCQPEESGSRSGVTWIPGSQISYLRSQTWVFTAGAGNR